MVPRQSWRFATKGRREAPDPTAGVTSRKQLVNILVGSMFGFAGKTGR